MDAVVIPDVELHGPTRYICRVAKLIPVCQIYTPQGRCMVNLLGVPQISLNLGPMLTGEVFGIETI